jgi:serine/threonine-protein kinase
MGDSLCDRLQSALGTAYTIERELGGGGMSRVFVALEAALGRQVVVKVLPPDMAAGVSIERFKREIQLAARLQHPHVVPLLSAGDADGLPYFTMPYVEGESLRVRLTKHGELPVAEAVRVLREIASALAYAHERGIVHRDIKPDNVLLSGGAAMVTDFGVAKALSTSSNVEHGGVTSLGIALGTPAYMSPEQASADPAVDHRADVYAFGVLAYELLAGQPPFSGRTPQGLLAAHVTEAPEPLHKRRPSLPAGLAALVMRCLEKRPADRPQAAAEIVRALDDLTTPSGGMPPMSSPPAVAAGSMVASTPPARRRRLIVLAGTAVALVLTVAAISARRLSHSVSTAAPEMSASTLAVLPFENVGGDTSATYFADGMTDELATALAKVPGLRVASRTSSYVFRKRDGLDAAMIAGRLHVGAILEGTVRRAGNQLRITAQLTRGSDGQSLWAEAFTTDAGDVFAVQARLTQAIVAAVAPALAGRPTQAVVATASNPGTRDVVAYDTYLRARYELNRRGHGVRRSIPLFEQALARDPTFAVAWAGLASAWAVLPYYDDWVTADGVLDSTQLAAERAIALDSLTAEAYTALGYALIEAGRFERGEPLLRRGVELSPRSAVARLWLGSLHRNLGQFDLAERAQRDAMALDPLSGNIIANVAVTVSMDPSRWDEARALARRATAVDPSNGGGISNAAVALANTHDYEESLGLVRRAVNAEVTFPAGGGLMIVDLVAVGKRDSAALALRELERSAHTTKRLQSLAIGAAALGQWDRAFAAANEAASASGTIDFVRAPIAVWRPVAHDPRFRSLCGRTRMNCDKVIRMVANAMPLR